MSSCPFFVREFLLTLLPPTPQLTGELQTVLDALHCVPVSPRLSLDQHQFAELAEGRWRTTSRWRPR